MYKILETAISNVDTDMLPPAMGVTLEHIECREHHHSLNNPTVRQHWTAEVTMWSGDEMVVENAAIGHISIWENGALTFSNHLHSNPVWVKLVQMIQFDVCSAITGK